MVLGAVPQCGVFPGTIGEVLRFLQSRLDEGRTYSTSKVYLASISACHAGYDGERVAERPLVPFYEGGQTCHGYGQAALSVLGPCRGPRKFVQASFRATVVRGPKDPQPQDCPSGCPDNG